MSLQPQRASHDSLISAARFCQGVPLALEKAVALLCDDPSLTLSDLSSPRHQNHVTSAIADDLTKRRLGQLVGNDLHAVRCLAVLGEPVGCQVVAKVLERAGVVEDESHWREVLLRLARRMTVVLDRLTDDYSLHPLDRIYALSMSPREQQQPFRHEIAIVDLHTAAATHFSELCQSRDSSVHHSCPPHLRVKHFWHLLLSNQVTKACQIARKVDLIPNLSAVVCEMRRALLVPLSDSSLPTCLAVENLTRLATALLHEGDLYAAEKHCKAAIDRQLRHLSANSNALSHSPETKIETPRFDDSTDRDEDGDLDPDMRSFRSSLDYSKKERERKKYGGQEEGRPHGSFLEEPLAVLAVAQLRMGFIQIARAKLKALVNRDAPIVESWMKQKKGKTEQFMSSQKTMCINHALALMWLGKAELWGGADQVARDCMKQVSFLFELVESPTQFFLIFGQQQSVQIVQFFQNLRAAKPQTQTNDVAFFAMMSSLNRGPHSFVGPTPSSLHPQQKKRQNKSRTVTLELNSLTVDVIAIGTMERQEAVCVVATSCILTLENGPTNTQVCDVTKALRQANEQARRFGSRLGEALCCYGLGLGALEQCRLREGIRFFKRARGLGVRRWHHLILLHVSISLLAMAQTVRREGANGDHLRSQAVETLAECRETCNMFLTLCNRNIEALACLVVCELLSNTEQVPTILSRFKTMCEPACDGVRRWVIAKLELIKKRSCVDSKITVVDKAVKDLDWLECLDIVEINTNDIPDHFQTDPPQPLLLLRLASKMVPPFPPS